MKKLLFSICLLAMAFSLNAQENQNLKGEIGLQVAGSAAVKPVQTYGISVQPYYKLTPKLSLGLGTGLIYTNHLGNDRLTHFSVPLYADLKYAFIKRKVTPFIEMRRGINFGFPGYKEYTYSNFGINYGSILLGVSVARSDISIGLMSYDYSQHGEHERYGADGGWVIHYAYNFKLSDKHVKEQAEKEYDTEGALNGRFNLLASGQFGILTPLFVLAEFSIPLNMNAGLMAEYRINKMFSVGIGVDVNATACNEILGTKRDEDKQRFCSLPVYADFRATFGKDEVRPFVDFRGGYAFALNTLRVHDSFLTAAPLRGEAQTKGLYSTAAVGVSVGHSDFSTGLCFISYQGRLESKDFKEFYAHLFFRYSYRFGLTD